jgi:signal transduction histidine kinase
MLEVFLGDRLLNLAGLTDNRRTLLAPRQGDLEASLAQLQSANTAFVDLAILDGSGQVLAYAGPLPDLVSRNYRAEAWFVRLLAGDARHVITDTYPGFRGEPHYTMALKLEPGGETRILRAVLSPVITAGQLAALDEGDGGPGKGSRLSGVATSIWLVTALFCALGGLLVWRQARWVAAQQFAALRTEQDLTRQLLHAARLATVGEITAGIAHEVNNPLAVVAEKAGLVRDLLDPRFGREPDREELRAHLQVIEVAVFRATSITQRLLEFVRPDEVRLVPCDVHQVVDTVLDDMLKSVLAAGAGEITVRTRHGSPFFALEIADTGKGMSSAELERVFMPFFTTKAPGAGTGLGLSISYGIVVGLGGRLSVTSSPGAGSVFRIELPCGR